MNACIKLLIVAALLVGSLLSAGCVTDMYPGGPSPAGMVYTEVTAPAQNLAIALDPTAKPEKEGSSESMAFLGLFAFGNAGLEEAMKSKGITKVHHVDHQVQHFLYAIFLRHKTIVYGE